MEGEVGTWAILALDTSLISTDLLGPHELQCASAVRLPCMYSTQGCKQCYNDRHSKISKHQATRVSVAGSAVASQEFEPGTRRAIQRSRLNLSTNREEIYPCVILLVLHDLIFHCTYRFWQHSW